MKRKKRHAKLCYGMGIPVAYSIYGTSVDYFEMMATAFPMRKIVMATGKLDASITYKEALIKVHTLSANLMKLMKGKKYKHIAIHLPSVPQHVIATMAVRHAGMVDIPVDPKWDQNKPEYIKEKLSEADVDCVITTDYMAKTYLDIRDDMPEKPLIIATHLSDEYSTLVKPLISLKLRKAKRWDNIRKLKKENPGVVFEWSDLIYKNWQSEKCSSKAERNSTSTLMFGSGTSGKQKIIKWKHNSLSHHIGLTLNYNMNPKGDPLSLEYGKETMLSVIPFSHSFGNAVCINMSLAIGANLILVPKPVKPIMKDGEEIQVLDEELLIKIIEKYRPTIVPLAPKIYAKILDYIEKTGHKPDFSFVKKFISGSAKLSKELARRWKKIFGVPIFEGYGLTETCTAGNVNHHLYNRLGTVGMPPPGVHQITVDENMNPVYGKEGEVLISGEFLFSEYYKNPEETKKVFWRGKNGRWWFKTGDIGVIDKEDLTLTIVGRKKYTIIRNGINVSPETVETAISNHSVVEDVAVLGLPDKNNNEKVAAVIILKDGNIDPEKAKKSITNLCNKKLGEREEVPTIFKFTSQAELEKIGALTGTGKIKRGVLKKYFF